MVQCAPPDGHASSSVALISARKDISVTHTDQLADNRAAIAAACRIAAGRGLVEGMLGHISLRIDDERLLIRCRSDADTGIEFTRPSDIRLVRFDGSAGATGELDGYRVPHELPIHVESMLAHPRHRAVAHLHPKATVAADLAGITITPIYGACDIPAAWLARGGVPVYPRAVLIRNSELGKEMVAAMGDRPIVICRGHGVASAATTVQQAVLQAIRINELAHMSLTVQAAGGTLQAIAEADFDDLPDLGAAFNTDAAWRHELARISVRHRGRPPRCC
jgi:ribulose-5-phosphate 4-epimerase/fuculose-1-phosphate aldolase